MFVSNPNTINFSVMESSVGVGGTNKPLDVLVVQRLLNACSQTYEGKVILKTDGFYGKNTGNQIKLFQKHVMKIKSPDSLVSVNKATHNKLLKLLNRNVVVRENNAARFFQKSKTDINHFVYLYGKQFPKEGSSVVLKKLVGSIFFDPTITDLRWVAYMLATVKRECGIKLLPTKEIGKGRGKDYDEEIEVTDPVSKATYKNVYYGRGYVQITWDYNYKKLGKAIGLKDRLYYHPDDALKEDISYKIMSVGMREGLFTGVRLAQFISGAACDYVGARKIINGNDHAKEIAKNAVIFEEFLKAAVVKQVLRPITGNKYANYA